MGKGQITIFIAVGIIVLFFIAGSVVLYQNMADDNEAVYVEKAASVPMQSASVDRYVEECLDETGKDAILSVFLQAGYYELPDKYFSMEYADIPYYYYDGDISQALSKQEIQSSIGKYINDNILYCLGNFSSFPGYELTVGEPTTEITIGKTKLTATMKLPITVNKEGVVTQYDTFRASYNARFDDIYFAMNEIMTNTIVDPYRIYYSLILNLMEDYDLQIDTLTSEDNTIIYVIQDEKSVINGVPVMFMFGVKVNTENILPAFEISGVMAAKKGEEFHYQVNAIDREGASLRYSTDSDVVGINPMSGEIIFTPQIAGNYSFNVYVSDGIDTVSKPTILRVTE